MCSRRLQAACEGDWSMDKLNLVGERIWNMERQFNLAAGMTARMTICRRA
jgi:aldehyde:ferredoxin oxidoreductase